MIYFIAGLILFLATHLYSAFRSRIPGATIIDRLGQNRYRGIYSLLAIISLILIVYGFAKMGPTPAVYTPPSWGGHVTWLFMFLALVTLAAYWFPAGYIKKTVKHPMVLSVKLWGIGHLFSNGNLRDVLLFGTFLIYVIVARVAFKRRRDLGAALATPSIKWDFAALAAGTAVYALFVLYLHQALFGVSPLGAT